jgi:hypothetical protein
VHAEATKGTLPDLAVVPGSFGGLRHSGLPNDRIEFWFEFEAKAENSTFALSFSFLS